MKPRKRYVFTVSLLMEVKADSEIEAYGLANKRVAGMVKRYANLSGDMCELYIGPDEEDHEPEKPYAA